MGAWYYDCVCTWDGQLCCIPVCRMQRRLSLPVGCCPFPSMMACTTTGELPTAHPMARAAGALVKTCMCATHSVLVFASSSVLAPARPILVDQKLSSYAWCMHPVHVRYSGMRKCNAKARAAEAFRSKFQVMCSCRNCRSCKPCCKHVCTCVHCTLRTTARWTPGDALRLGCISRCALIAARTLCTCTSTRASNLWLLQALQAAQ